MRITHLTSVHPRYDTRIFHKHAVFSAESGFDTSLLVNDKLGNEVQNNVQILSTNWSFESKLIRVLYSIFLFPFKAKSIDSDLYVFHDPELLICGAYLKLIRKKVIYDIHEDYELIHFENRGIVRRLLGRLYRLISFSLIQNFDGVFVVNERLKNKFNRIARRLILLPNYPILTKSHSLIQGSSTDKLRIVFAGGIKKDWNIMPFATLLSLRNDVEFHLVGKPNEYLNSILSKNFQNLTYHGHLSHQETLDLLTQMDIGLAYSSSVQLQGDGSIGNTKVFEYLQNGLAVIVNNNAVWRNIIESNKVGFLLNQPLDLTEILDRLLNDRKLLSKIKLTARDLVYLKYNWNTSFVAVNDFFEDLQGELRNI